MRARWSERHWRLAQKAWLGTTMVNALLPLVNALLPLAFGYLLGCFARGRK